MNPSSCFSNFYGNAGTLIPRRVLGACTMLQQQECVAVTDTRESEKLQQLFTSQPFVEEDR